MPDADVPVVDEIAVKRLCQLRDQVARPGEDVLGELLSLFERDAQVRVVALRAALALPDPSAAAEARRQAAHALKGAAGNIGAARVAATAAHVERNEVDRSIVDLLQREVDVALQALRTRLA
jgi:HPt (histidine-containing phosphotransfer) domain-containing protein